MWDKGAMDGACNIAVAWKGNKYCGTQQHEPACVTNGQGNTSTCSYTFVENKTDLVTNRGVLDPYFQIANQYGFANLMFQTNQGPSFPAHQFLFSGTSAPVYYGDPGNNCDVAPHEQCWQWFAAENASGSDAGCISGSNAQGYLLTPGSDENYFYTPPSPVSYLGFPCYDHPTLTDLLSGGAWKYYARDKYDLWTAPDATYHICVPTGPGG